MKRPSLHYVAALLLPALLCFPCAVRAADAPQGRAVPVDGQPFLATIAAIDNWNITWQTGQTQRSTSAADLVEWGQPAQLPRQAQVLLVDGGTLVVDSLGTQDDVLTVINSLLGKLIIPLELVSGVVFNPPAEALRRDELVDRLFQGGAEQPGADRLLLDNDDALRGTLLGIADEGIRLEAQVGEVTVPRDKVAALAFSPALLAEPESPEGVHAVIALADGSRIPVVSLAVSKGQAIFAPQGSFLGERPEWKTKAEHIVYLQPRGGRCAYLSDRQAESYRHVPYLTLSWPYRVDRNVQGLQLRGGGREYLKGIGMHSAARLTYRLDDGSRRFDALLAIDDATLGKGSVVFRVFVDTEQRYVSPEVRGGEQPLPISVDVTGGRLLSLIVDYGEQGDQLDHANWLNARLIGD